MRKSFTLILTLVLIMMFTASYGQRGGLDHSAQTQQLASAVRSGNLEAVKKTYSHFAVQGIDPVTGIRPLHLASKLGNYEIVEYFILLESKMESGVYVTQEEMPPMIHAIKNGHDKIVELLFKKGSRHPNGVWMNKTYLFHALHMNANQSTIDLLVDHGADMKLAKSHMPVKENLAEDAATAKKWTDEIAGKVQLNEFYKIDIWNLNVMASNMLKQMKDKYGADSAEFSREKKEIYDWRMKKLQRIIPPNKFAKLGQLSKQ